VLDADLRRERAATTARTGHGLGGRRGRNRLAACEKAGVEPDFITYADGDPHGYALAVINRRHLKPGAPPA
jgi:hypothetical protein